MPNLKIRATAAALALLLTLGGCTSPASNTSDDVSDSIVEEVETPSEQAPEASQPESSVEGSETPSGETETPPEEPDVPQFVDQVYTVSTQEEAADILAQAFAATVEEVVFDLSQSGMTPDEKTMLLKNASYQVYSETPELKYAYDLTCTEDGNNTICQIAYMPYRLGYPDGQPEQAAHMQTLSDLIAVANDALGSPEIPIVIEDPTLAVDDMQMVLQQAGYAYVVYSLNQDATKLIAAPADGDSLDACVAKARSLQETAASIAAELVDDSMTAEEKMAAFYDYIVENTTYDYRYYQNPTTLPYESRTASGPLVQKTAICGGFSWAFRMLCETAGISCFNVSGVGNGEDHMWNCALYDGTYRFFDTTWDSGAKDQSQWRYFAKTEEEFSQGHTAAAHQMHLLELLTGQSFSESSQET